MTRERERGRGGEAERERGFKVRIVYLLCCKSILSSLHQIFKYLGIIVHTHTHTHTHTQDSLHSDLSQIASTDFDNDVIDILQLRSDRGWIVLCHCSRDDLTSDAVAAGSRMELWNVNLISTLHTSSTLHALLG